jgi:aminoacylase
MMLTLLENYIALNTSYPNNNYAAVVALFKRIAAEDGFVTQVIPLPSGYPVLIITLEGTDRSLPALGLNHHMDVVPAAYEEGGWYANPFSLHQRGSLLIGRGVQDMKGVGVVHYAALQAFKQLCPAPARTIHLLLVPDEERGGFQGTGQLIKLPAFDKLRLGYVLDEGMPSGNDHQLFIKVAERIPLQIRVTARGTTAHSSFMHASNPVHELITCLHELTLQHEQEKKTQIHSRTPAGCCFSYHITSLTAGDCSVVNRIPASAQAIVDIRVPPQQPCSSVITYLNKLTQKYKHITYTLADGTQEIGTALQKLAVRMEQADTTTAFYRTLTHALEQKGIESKPLFFEGTTDTRFYTSLGIESLGLTPFTCAPNLHGINEAMYTHDLEQGKQLVAHFLTLFCT